MIARVAAAALPVALVTLAIAGAAVAGAWLRWLPPLTGLGLFVLAVAGGGLLSLVLGLAGTWTAAGAEDASRTTATMAAALGLCCLVLFVALAAPGIGAPSIHDITTDVDDPPRFVAAAENPANAHRDLSYPNGADDTARLQQEGYPDLAPIDLATDPDAAYRASLDAAAALGWRVTAENRQARTFEAEAETAVFGFVDDVVVRVRAHDGGARVDVRSLSRVGVGDLGANAARIRSFQSVLSGS